MMNNFSSNNNRMFIGVSNNASSVVRIEGVADGGAVNRKNIDLTDDVVGLSSVTVYGWAETLGGSSTVSGDSLQFFRTSGDTDPAPFVVNITSVPEPMAMGLMGLGSLVLLIRRRSL